MRFLVGLPPLADGEGLDETLASVSAGGADGVLLTGPAALVAAAAAAGHDGDLLLAAEVELGARSPLEVAEEAAVVDHAARGRLILVARPTPGCEPAFTEHVDRLRRAWVPRPFALPGGAVVRVTPAPFGTAVCLWLAGPTGAAATERGLGHLADEGTADADLAGVWVQAGAAASFVPRARREGARAGVTLVRRLEAGRAAFGQDWAVLTGPVPDVLRALRHARPRLQLPLPAGLDAYWTGLEKQTVD